MMFFRLLCLLFALGILVSEAPAQSAAGRVTTSAPTYGDATTSPLSLDTSGNLRVRPSSTGTIAGAVPAAAGYTGINVGGNLTGLVGCNSSAKIDTASAGNVELVALSGSTVIRVCGYNFIANGTVAVQMIYGTGTACATGETDLTGAYNLVANSGIVVQSPFWTGMAGAAGNALCIELSGAVQVSGVVFYTQY